MEENPYEPATVPSDTPSQRHFLQLPTTLAEWVVIALVGFVLLCVFLPDFPAYFDDPTPQK